MDKWIDGWIDGHTNKRTDGRMDGQNRQMEKLRNGTTDIAGYKVACTRLKWGLILKRISKVHRLTYSCVQQKNKAGYTATPVACRWAGAVLEKVTRAFGQEQ